jgi:uncharacterized protein YdaU (DUF1376 family)
MGKLQWYKRDTAAALEGMACLTLEERGAYNTVLDLIYLHDGSVDDDLRYIAGFLRVDVRIWKRIRNRLVELGKLYNGDGKLRNKRADVEVRSALAKVVRTQELNVIKGIKSGAVRRKNKELAEPEPNRSRTDLELDIESKKDIRSVSKKAETRPSPTVVQFDSFKKAYPKRGASNPWQPALKLFLSTVDRDGEAEAGAIIHAAGLYREECDRLKITGTDKVAQAQTWLRQKRFMDYLDGTEADAGRRAEHRAAAERLGWRLIEGAWVKPDETAIGG